MDFKLIITALVQIIVTFFLGIFSAFLALRIFGWVDNKTDIQTELNKGNTAVAIILAAFILSIMIIVRGSVDTAVTNMNMVFAGVEYNWIDFLKRLGLSALHIVVSLSVSFLLIVVSITVFKALTDKIDELKEISKNNVAVAIMLASVVVGMAVILEPGVKALLDSLVIFPPVGSSGFIVPGLK